MAERGIDILIQVRDQASATLKAIESNFAGFQGKLNGLASAVANIGNVMRGSLAGLGAAAGASGLTNLVQGVVNVGTQMQSLRTTMTVVTGSSEKAGEAFQFVRQTADRLGFDTAELAKSYVSLTAASQGTALAGQQTKEVFLAVATAGRTLGLSTDQMNGALLAVQQMMSKGTVQAEELRGQLGERLPGAFQIAARAMGVTTQELGKMLEQGRVMANDFLPKFAAQLQKELGGGVEAASQTAVAAFARFRNALTDMATSIAQSGVLDLLAQLANAFAWVLKQAQGSAAGIHEAVQTYQQSMVALSKMSALLPSADTAAMSEMYRQRSVLQTRLAGLTTGREAVQPGDLEGIERIRETTAALANLEDQIKQAEKAAQQLAEVDVMGAVTLPVDPLAWTKPLTEAQKTFETTQAKLYETLKTAGADSIEQIDQQLVGLRKRYSELVAQIIAVPEARKAEKPILAAQLADVRAAIQVYDEERKAIQKNTQERLAAAQKEADELKRRDKAAQDALVTARAGVAAATDGWEAAMRIRLEYEQTDPVMIERLVHLEREKRAQEALNKTAEERKKLYDDQLKIARDIVTEYQLVSSIPEQDRESERLRRRLSALEPDFRADVVIADEGRRQWLKTEEDAKANARDFLALQEQIAEALARIGFGEEEIARKERERYLLKAQALTTDEEALRVLMEQYDVLQRQSEEMAKQRESAQFMEDVREPVRPQPRTRREAYEQGLERMRETNVPQARIAEAQRLVEHRLAAETLNDVLEYSRDLAESLGETLEESLVDILDGAALSAEGFGATMEKMGKGLIKLFGQEIIHLGLMPLRQSLRDLASELAKSDLMKAIVGWAGKALGLGLGVAGATTPIPGMALTGPGGSFLPPVSVGAHGGIFGVQAMARGGLVPSASLRLLGEAGPEAVVPLTSAGIATFTKGLQGPASGEPGAASQASAGEMQRMQAMLERAMQQKPPVEMTVILNNPVDPRKMGLQPEEVVQIVGKDINNDGIVRRIIMQKASR